MKLAVCCYTLAISTLIALTGPPSCHAGVITTGAGDVVLNWTANDGTKYNFTGGSYNTITGFAPSLVTVFTDAEAIALTTELAGQLNTDALSGDYLYHFVVDPQLGPDHVQTRYVDETSPGNWQPSTAAAIQKTDGSQFPSHTIFYASVETNSAVPEPSTAIAMGLLGVVGFAGSRRRRR